MDTSYSNAKLKRACFIAIAATMGFVACFGVSTVAHADEAENNRFGGYYQDPRYGGYAGLDLGVALTKVRVEPPFLSSRPEPRDIERLGGEQVESQPRLDIGGELGVLLAHETLSLGLKGAAYVGTGKIVREKPTPPINCENLTGPMCIIAASAAEEPPSDFVLDEDGYYKRRRVTYAGFDIVPTIAIHPFGAREGSPNIRGLRFGLGIGGRYTQFWANENFGDGSTVKRFIIGYDEMGDNEKAWGFEIQIQTGGGSVAKLNSIDFSLTRRWY